MLEEAIYLASLDIDINVEVSWRGRQAGDRLDVCS